MPRYGYLRFESTCADHQCILFDSKMQQNLTFVSYSMTKISFLREIWAIQGDGNKLTYPNRTIGKRYHNLHSCTQYQPELNCKLGDLLIGAQFNLSELQYLPTIYSCIFSGRTRSDIIYGLF